MAVELPVMNYENNKGTGMEIKTLFEIGEKVHIDEFNIKGIIESINIDRVGVTYYVRYFYNGEFKGSYFPEDVLERMSASASGVGYMVNN